MEQEKERTNCVNSWLKMDATWITLILMV